MRNLVIMGSASLAALLVMLPLDRAAAQTSEAPTPAPTGYENAVGAYFDNWFNRVNQAQSTQPHWMTPLVTVTPRLEEEVRYDQWWEHLPNGGSIENYDTGKGLELIPTTTNEIIIGAPPYEERTRRSPAAGWGDWPFLLVKQRLLSADEQHGNYIVSAFFAVQAPVGARAFTNNSWTLTPTIAGGKGWGDFDVQATVGVAIPTDRTDTVGAQLISNVALQYHLLTYFWPELEVNHTLWLSGSQRGGKNQVFLTPGLILGRFQLGGRARFAIGVGYQFAVSPHERLTPVLNPTYDHNWILSARLSF